MLARHQVISRFLDMYKEPSYLEVGVNAGETFTAVTAARKVAVDPQFLFDTAAHNPGGGCIYHQLTSDAFFAEHAARTGPFDVIYLDGLHTFEQTLRDLMNALAFLRPGGVIVIDDVLPNSQDAALPDYVQAAALREAGARIGPQYWPYDGSWMGDVYKLVFFIDTFLPQLSFATVPENHGQTVVWEQPRAAAAIVQRTMEQITRLDYRDTILRRAEFKLEPLEQIAARIASAPAYRARREVTW